MLGEYKSSGFRHNPYLARRSDGRVVQLTPLLYQVLLVADGERSSAVIAREVSWNTGREISAEAVDFLASEKLLPAGLVVDATARDATARDATARDATDTAEPEPLAARAVMFALRHKATLLSSKRARAMARVVSGAFSPLVVVSVLSSFGLAEAWLFGQGHALYLGLHSMLARPLLVLIVLAILVASGGLHELGHAGACQRGGAEPGPIGIGLYLVWPVFFSDVTSSYALSRRSRVRVDLGGVYFNCIGVLITFGAYYLSHAPFLLVAVLVQEAAALQQLLPVLRLDGYYLVSDLAGVPDLYARVAPVVGSLAFWRPLPRRAAELRPGARAIIVAWVLFALPMMAGGLALFFVSLPHVAPKTAGAVADHAELAYRAMARGRPAAGLLSGLDVVVLLLPVAGVSLGLARTAKLGLRVAMRLARPRGARGNGIS